MEEKQRPLNKQEDEKKDKHSENLLRLQTEIKAFLLPTSSSCPLAFILEILAP